MYKLYTIAEWSYSPHELGAWCKAVWAPNTMSAIQWGYANYDGESVSDPGIYVLYYNEDLTPMKEDVHEETRAEVLRQADWFYEGERRCDVCGLFACGIDEFEVCSECRVCRDCAKKRSRVL